MWLLSNPLKYHLHQWCSGLWKHARTPWILQWMMLQRLPAFQSQAYSTVQTSTPWGLESKFLYIQPISCLYGKEVKIAIQFHSSLSFSPKQNKFKRAQADIQNPSKCDLIWHIQPSLSCPYKSYSLKISVHYLKAIWQSSLRAFKQQTWFEPLILYIRCSL